MRRIRSVSALVALVSAGALTIGIVAQGAGASGYRTRTYEVTIENLAQGQPLSPAVVATHRRSLKTFRVGRPARPELESIAEDGNQLPAVASLEASRRVTDVVDVGVPLLPRGGNDGGLSDSATFEIDARRGDRLSLATMLICSNDGFTALNGVRLPNHHSRSFYGRAYDAGTEMNTEASSDIVDPCSAIGPVPLAGDPNGNENDAVDTDSVVRRHPGIAGIADLDAAAHGWHGPIVKVTVTRTS